MAEGNQVVKVCVSIPNEGSPPCEAYTNRLDNFFYLGMLQQKGHEQKLSPRFEFAIITLGRIFTPLAREEAASQAIEMGADYLFMIDDDMTCPNNLFERLYAHNVDLVAPLAFTRNYPHHAVLYDIKEGWDPVSKENYFINHYIDEYPKDSLVECDAVGFGAALIKTEILKKLSKPWFMSSSATGEDILFCHKARKAGFRVFMDTATKLGHLSHPVEVTEDYVQKVRKEFKYKEDVPLKPKYEQDPNSKATLILGD